METIAQTDMFGPTIEDAKARMMLEAQRSQGTHCPCCTKFVKVHHRKFNSGMAVTMIYTYPWFRSHPLEWLQLGRFLIRNFNFWPSDYGKLVWWGMLEKHPDPPKKSGAKSSGLYRMTSKGFAFTRREILVPSHVHEYKSVVQSFDGDEINIRGALGRKFDYGELMQAAGRWS